MLVIGGNQGSNTFNRRLKLPILENYLREVNIVHQTGSSSLTNDHKIALNQRNRLNQKLRSRYLVYDFLKFEELNNVLNQTSLVLSRSGANTTQLIMYKGIPTIFMPLPWSSNNEQLENAQIAAETGLAKVFEFKEGLTEQALFSVLEKAIDQITQRKSFKSNTTWTEAKQAALKLAQINAAELIAASIIDNTTTKSS